MKKVWMAMVMAALVMAVSAQAQDKAPVATPPAAVPPAPVVKKERPPAQDLELVGKVTQVEKVRKGKDGVETKQTVLMLDIAADGIQVALPAAGKTGVDATQFVGKDVKVFAKGTSEVNPKGKKTIRIVKVDKIEPLAK